MERSNGGNVIINYYVQLIMKCIFEKFKNKHYLYSMKNDVMKVILKVYHGVQKHMILHMFFEM